MASEKFHSKITYVIIILVAVFVVATILFGINDTFEFLGVSIPTPDYIDYYIPDWSALISGDNPYHYFFGAEWRSSYYPIGFLVFSGVYAIHPVVPKILFCIVLAYTAYFINGICKKYDVSQKATIYYCFGLLMINPVYLGSIVVSGHYDVVIGLCVLLAVYCVDKKDQIKSGMYGAFAFLLKFIGIILIFPLTFMKKKINWRVGLAGLSICGIVYLIGYSLWGDHIINPFLSQLFRAPEEGSIFLVIKEVLGIDLMPLLPYILIAGAIFVAILLYFINTDVASFSLIVILGFLMISPVYYVHYGTWFLPLSCYWSMKHNGRLQGTIFLYHLGGFASGLVSWYISMWIGAIIAFLTTGLYALLVFLYRTKEDSSQTSEGEE